MNKNITNNTTTNQTAELIPVKINNETEQITVSSRDLHMFLEVETPYHKWFPRMCEYGFTEGADFNTDKIVRVQIEGSREVSREITDHLLTIDMAKEIAMLQRNDKGKQARQYFIQCEKNLKTPSYLIEDEIERAKKWIIEQEQKRALKIENAKLFEENQKLEARQEAIINISDGNTIVNNAVSFRDAFKYINSALGTKMKKERYFKKFLTQKGFLQPKNQMPTNKALEKGVLVILSVHTGNFDFEGNEVIARQAKITVDGLQIIKKFVAKKYDFTDQDTVYSV